MARNTGEFAPLCSDEGITPRKLLHTYCVRTVKQLCNLRLVQQTDSARLLVVLSSVVKDHEYAYTFGNEKLAYQLSFWRKQELAREQTMRVPDSIHTVQDEIAAREQRKSNPVQSRQVDLSEQVEFMEDNDSTPGPSGLARKTAPSKSRAPAPDSSDEELELERNVFKLTTDQDMEIEIGTEKFSVPHGTPVKMTPVKKKRRDWSDFMKFQLLCLYVEKSLDPLARPDKARGRAVYRRTVPENGSLIASTIQQDNLEEVRLDKFPLDTIHTLLASGKLSRQPGTKPGLVNIIDTVIGDQPRTRETLNFCKAEIFNLARKYAVFSSELENSESD